MYLVIHRSMSVVTILPSGWNALHTLLERSRIITKTPPLMPSFLFLTRGYRNCFSIMMLFHFAPVVQPRRNRPVSPAPKSHNLNIVFYFMPYDFFTLNLWSPLPELRASFPFVPYLCLSFCQTFLLHRVH